MNENPFGLQVAKPEDGEALWEFVLPILQEDAAQTVSLEKAALIVERCLIRNAAIAGVLRGPNGIEASVGATMDRFDYTDEPHLMVRWLGVAPALRKTGLGQRMVSYVHWLYERLAAENTTDTPVPVFIPALRITDAQRRKMLLYSRHAPLVGMLHGYGCLPDVTPIARAGQPGATRAASDKEPSRAKPPPAAHAN